MATQSVMVPLPWKLLLVALFLLGMSIPLHEKLERRREERSALRRALAHSHVSSADAGQVAKTDP